MSVVTALQLGNGHGDVAEAYRAVQESECYINYYNASQQVLSQQLLKSFRVLTMPQKTCAAVMFCHAIAAALLQQ